ncbi:DEAD/DEAH box helicase [Lactobacillus sp. PSON]|uniref:DEAD/DEAH box helicase n=1 Tax=Lactobacillus sp. PSON TaxID=3455454 RepID=UPI004041B7B5
MNKVLKNALLNGLYDKKYLGHENLNPKLLTNENHDNIWLTLRQELLTCQSFTWAVAFITEDMLVPFKLVMEDLAKKGISGTLITGSYLGFNSPKVFYELLKIKNLTVKISSDNFHAKGYFFRHLDYETVIVGSANFTRSALLSNYELAMRITSSENATMIDQVQSSLTKLKQNSFDLTDDWIKSYEQNWEKPVSTNFSKKQSSKIIPNKMQRAALKELNRLVDVGENRSLVVSATGTGKTYLGAFAVKDFKPKKFLYVVHREQIAKKALESFYQVIGGKKSDYGMLTGKKHDMSAKYIFATVQTLNQDYILEEFSPSEFDYILIDEAHRSAAPSYQKVLNYFKPKFYLGMTATPERMDEKNVYEIFDYNLAYEIRLQDALKEHMLAPFHYVGVEDYEADGEIIDETSNLNKLTAKKRVDYILHELDYYGYCGSKPKGLIFCSRTDEAKKLAEEFNLRNHKSVSLTNQDTEKVRQKVVRDLENGKIEYIITVDLFNEGVDIPSLNQIIMLRNTESSIVFIQQLGRGLRKYPGKEYVTVIDFIGNYKNNYMIPLALNHDVSLDKDKAYEEVKIPQLIDVSTINFNQIAAKKILASLEKIKLDSMKNLRDSYNDLKQKLGRVPKLYDFYKYGASSPLVFATNNLVKNYAEFLQKMGEDIQLSEYENQTLTFITKELLAGKRPHELVLLDLLLQKEKVEEKEYISRLQEEKVYVSTEVLESIERILTLKFFDVKAGKTTKKEQYGNFALIKKVESQYYFSNQMQSALKNSQYREFLQDLIKTGLLLTQEYSAENQFTLYKKYDREDVCRLLNWPLDVSAPMYGYRVGENETPIFITYKKDSEEKRNSIYHNDFSDGQTLRWYTRSPRHINSKEVQNLLKPNMKLHVFVKRSDAAGKEFFYLGEAKILQESVKEELLGPKKKAAVGMNLQLKQPLSNSMYNILFAD